jgi:GNAT superfamily N-acetyltransferase
MLAAPAPAAVTVRRAQEADLRAVRLLLPDAFDRFVPSETWIAVSEHPLTFRGAAAATAHVWDDQRVWRLHLHVARGNRRCGIGTRLMDSAITSARRRGIEALEGWFSLDDTAAEPFLRHCGFAPFLGFTTFQADSRRLMEVILPIRDHAVTRSHTPAGGRIVPLADAPFEQVMRLHVEHIGGTRQLLMSRSPAELIREFRHDGSLVLMIGDEVKGLILVGIRDGVATIHASIVHPDLQRTSANALLMASALDQGVHLLGENYPVRFVARDGHRHTPKLARRADAAVVSRQQCYRLTLPAELTPGRPSSTSQATTRQENAS